MTQRGWILDLSLSIIVSSTSSWIFNASNGSVFRNVKYLAESRWSVSLPLVEKPIDLSFRSTRFLSGCTSGSLMGSYTLHACIERGPLYPKHDRAIVCSKWQKQILLARGIELVCFSVLLFLCFTFWIIFVCELVLCLLYFVIMYDSYIYTQVLIYKMFSKLL